MSHCNELCVLCAATLTPDGGDCILSCTRVILRLGVIDPTCLAGATDCRDAMTCVH